MLNKDNRPSTIGGIKRHAKQIKKSSGVTHHEALDLAARNASYENFSHARNQLQSVNSSQFIHNIFFTVYWYDRTSGKAGREVLEVELSKPLNEIATKIELKKSNALAWFRLATDDLLVSDQVSHSQNDAIKTICKAVRVLRFIEATGLKPSSDSEAAYPKRNPNNRLPKSDHPSNWLDSVAGQSILIDEPYLDPEVDQERAAWAKKHNWHLQASNWPGMYYPGMTSMFVATDASTGYDFKNLMNRIESIPLPITEENWTGLSSKGHDTFFSTLCVSQSDKKRAIARGTIYRASSSKTVPMRSWDAPDNERRPNAVMSIDSHLRAAKIIIAIQRSSARPASVHNRLNLIKSTLENWFFSEYEKGVTDNYDLFYYSNIDSNDHFVIRAESSIGVVALLEELKELLVGAYVDCAPLRKLTDKINTSIKQTSRHQ